MDVSELRIPGVKLLIPERFEDERGFFSEVYNARDYIKHGVTSQFVQDSHSFTHQRGTIRGLHFQVEPHPVAKLVRVSSGAIIDVVVDLRHGSPTFGDHLTVELNETNWAQLFVPIGLAHGFCTLKPGTEVLYKVTDHWEPSVDQGIVWNDPDLDIVWPIEMKDAIVSAKDAALPRLADLPPLFYWRQ